MLGKYQFRLMATLWSIFSSSEQRGLWLYLPFALAAAALELGGIASLVPVIAVLARPESLTSIPFFSEYLQGPDDLPFAGVLVVCSIGAWILRDLVLTGLKYYQMKLSQDIQARLSAQLLDTYLNKPYEWFLQRSGNSLSENVLVKASSIVSGLLLPISTVCVALATLAFLVLGIATLDMAVALTVGVLLFVVYGLLYLKTRRHFSEIGERLRQIRIQKFKVAGDTFSALKEVKLLRAEDHFQSGYSETVGDQAKTELNLGMRSYYPSVLVRSTFVSVLLAAAYFFGEAEITLPRLTFFVLALARMMPAFQRVFNGSVTLLSQGPTVREISDDLSSLKADLSPKVTISSFQDSLAMEAVSYRYPGKEIDALLLANFEISRGEMVAVVGISGAGKSTLLDVLSGLLSPQHGRVLLDGRPREDNEVWSFVGYVPQSSHLTEGTIAENICFGRDRDEERLQAVLAATLSSGFVEELEEGLESQLGGTGTRLSSGQRQRIGLCRALYSDPELLLLDEATNALDFRTEKQVLKNITKDRTVILVTHRLQVAKKADRCLVLENGQLLDWEDIEDEGGNS